MLELMARSYMRIGEVLKLTPLDIDDRKAIIREPKSGKEAESEGRNKISLPTTMTLCPGAGESSIK
jgi:integrase